MSTLMPVWPAGFLPAPKRDAWEGVPFDSRAAFEPEVGPPMFRARVTAEAWQFSGVFPTVDLTERDAFFAFWGEIKAGSLPFLWRDSAYGGAIRKWLFAKDNAYRIAQVAHGFWDIRVAMIRLASTPWWASLIPADRLVAPVAAYDMVRGLYHDGTAQIGASAAISGAPGIIRAHGTRDVRLLTGAGVATVLLSQNMTAGWWPGSPPVGLASITVFEAGALA